MIRKISLIAALFLTVIGMNAQTVGEWNLYTYFSGQIDDIVETPQKVYYTSGNRLFSFDKDYNETYSFTTQNKLNDINVTGIKYNPDGKYLIISYDNGNIDLLYDNDRVINMSDIKDATLTYNKGIRSISFGNGRIYVGTDFGIVIYDDSKHQVVESGIYGTPVTAVFPLGKYLFIATDADGLNYAPIEGYHNTYSKFTGVKDNNDNKISVTWADGLPDGQTMLYRNPSGKLAYITFDVSGHAPVVAKAATHDDVTPTSTLIRTAKGNYVLTAKNLVVLKDNGEKDNIIALPASIQNSKVASLCDTKSVWVGDADGIANYDISDGSLTILSDKYKPEGIVTNEVFYIRTDNWGNIWTGNLGVTNYKPGIPGGDKYGYMQATTRIKDGHPEDMTLYSVNASTGVKKKVVEMATGFAVDPWRPNRYYQGTNISGLYVLEKDEDTGQVKQLHLFTNKNSPLVGYTGYGARALDVQFDPDNNLWVAIWADKDRGTSTAYMLPASILQSKEPKDIQISDWQASALWGVDDGGNKDETMLICKHSPVMFTFSSSYDHAMGVTKTNGTWGDTSDDQAFEFFQPTDQDGKTWVPSFIICAAEDHRGHVWFGGSSGGVIEIADPKNLQPNTRINRIKVPRNDGTNYADYLCETDRVYGIAVDNSNRKWIATGSSGVYLVSEDGDKIIEHFTTANSPLPSNEVISVACDPNSNTVYFGLLSGLVSYKSTSGPSSNDYENIYAYPNPVRPDYTGYITVTGLMDDSLVKITDNAGNLVHQTRSEGGMAIWDGTDNNHNPVKSGVYYVFVSEGANGGSKGAVTKIMIIR